jgi:hypothetical protein
MAALLAKDGEWASPFCCSCGCMQPMAPMPWFDTSPKPGPGTGSTPRTCLGLDPELWNTPPATAEQLGCLCCWTLTENFEALGMFEDGSLPFKPSSKTQCCIVTTICCVGSQLAPCLFPLPLYVAKQRMKAAEVCGIKQSSFMYNLGAGFVLGPVANQISRELIIRGKMPRAKPAPDTAPPL